MENGFEMDVEWIEVAQYGNKFQAVVITVMNCRVP
jgi:hypothetical protein